MDDITIGVTEFVNNISVSAQPNDQIIDITVTETVETVLLDVSTTVQEVTVTATQNVIVENITVDYVNNENNIDINVTDATQDVTLNVTPTLVEINILRSGGEVNILQFDSLADFPATGSSDYFYLAKDTNKLYRWTGSAYAEISATSSPVWGQIIGTLSEQTDLQNALNLKAPINSPTFTGTVSGITKTMVGLGAVDNTSDLDKPISTATQTALNNKQPLDADLTSIAALSDTFGLLKKTANNSYTIDTNTYLTGITSSDVTTALGYTPENVANKGVNNGYASLGGDGKVPSSQLPSYVDDVIEVSSFGTLPATGETGKIYITLDTNKIYRWSGSVYVEVSSSAAVWGGITGTLSNQTDLQTALDAKQDDLNGTGFVKASGTTISYDNTTYYPASNPNGYTSNTGTVTSVAMTVPSAFSVSGSPITSSGTLAITGAGTTAQYVRGDGTLATLPDIAGFVPYTGATGNVNLGTHTIIAAKGTFSSSGSSDTVGITHSSGSGISLNIIKGGSGEGIYVNKTSGSGNAVTIIGTLNATTLVKSGGTSAQFLKADGSVDSSTYLTSASLSGYVATSGDQTISGTKTFTGFGLFDNTIFIKQDSSVSFLAGYNSIDSDSTGIIFSLPAGNMAKFILTSLSASRDYTLPNASGTIALTSDIPSLAGYVATTGDQSISGYKTFTTGVLANLLKFNESGGFNNIPGYTQIGGTADNFIFINGAGTKQAQFIYNSGGGNNYTLPTGNGTLALTSDIHNAVTIGTANGLSLSTQVLSLALASTSATGALSSTDWNTFNGKQNALTNPVTGTGTSSYLPKFTGTSAIGNSLLYDTGSALLIGATSASDASSKLELIGSGPIGLKVKSTGANGNNTFLSIESSKEWRLLTNRGDLIGGNQGDLIIRNNTDGINHIILNQGGSTTFAGALSGTSASFTTNLNWGSTSGSYMRTVGGTQIFASSYTGSNYLYSGSDTFRINNQADTATLFTLTNTGAATFSSSVTAASATLSSTASNKLTLSGGSTQNGLTLSEISGHGNNFYLFNGDGGLGNGFGIYNNTTSTLPFHISNGGISIFSSGLSRMLLFNSTNASGPYAAWQRNGSDEFYIGKSNAIGGGSGFYDLYTNSAGGGLRFFTNGAGSPALTITTGQSIGIGTTPSGNWGSRSVLQLGGFGTSLSGFNGGGGATNLSHNAIANAFNYTYLINGGATSQYMDGSDIVWANAPSGTAGNAITFSERMRIDTSGRLLVGTSSPISSASNTSIGATFGLTFNWLAVTDSNYIQRSNNSQGDYFSFYRGSTYTGSISVLGSTTYFNATSDYRLKEDLKNINGLETVNKIKVYDYKWKESDQRMDGVLAHELAEVLPYAVTGVKDGDKMQSVDYSKIVPVMVQAIKELKAELDTLKNK